MREVKEVRGRRSIHACMAMTMGWNETNTRTSSANVRCVQENECYNTEQGLRRQTTLRARSRVHQVCHVIVEFHVLCGDLGFHVVIGVGRLTVQFHHAYAIPSTKFFSSGCCSLTLSCHRHLKLYPKFLHISHRENGSFEVLSSHSPSITVDRRQL